MPSTCTRQFFCRSKIMEFVTLNEILQEIHQEQNKTSNRASKGAYKRGFVKLNVDIMRSGANTSDFKEMNKVIQQANRRIDNIQKRGLASSAVKSVISQFGGKIPTVSNYSEMSAMAWEQLKDTYARAVSFMNNPTSTVTGVKAYTKRIAKRFNTTFDNAQRLIDIATSAEINSNGLIDVFRYRENLDAFSDYLDEMRDRLEMSDEQYARYVEKNLTQAYNDFINQASEAMTKDVSNIINRAISKK